MREVSLDVRDTFSTRASALSEFIKLCIFHAIGVRALEVTPLTFPSNGGFTFAFYPSEILWNDLCSTDFGAPRFVIHLKPRRPGKDAAPAACTCEIELRSTRSGGPGPLDISINLPDTILGLENLQPGPSKSTYRGVYFNTTVGEHSCNLFELLPAIARAVAVELASHLADAKRALAATDLIQTA